MKHVFITEYFESSALALYMKLVEKTDVRVYVENKEYEKILKDIIEKEKSYIQFMGGGNLFVIDDASHGFLADSLRKKGELVFGGSDISDKMENSRQFGQSIARKYGIDTPASTNFKGHQSFDQAIQFVKANRKKWVIKQNYDLGKELSTIGKFDNGEDILDKLEDYKQLWEGEKDFDLQEFVDGHEVGVDGWFNGKDWIKGNDGKPFLTANWEHKKKSEGDTGRSTGEVGTLARRLDSETPLAREILKLTPYLKKIKYIGNIDINFIISKSSGKFYFLEFTNRFGYPFLDLQQHIFKSSFSDLLLACAKGTDYQVDYEQEWQIVVVIQAPPFPFEASKSLDNAKGQRVYFTGGKWTGRDELTVESLKTIHPHELAWDKEKKHFYASGDSGYLMTVTESGKTPKEANQKATKIIQENIYTSNMDYRKDIGTNKRVSDCIEFCDRSKLI